MAARLLGISQENLRGRIYRVFTRAQVALNKRVTISVRRRVKVSYMDLWADQEALVDHDAADPADAAIERLDASQSEDE